MMLVHGNGLALPMPCCFREPFKQKRARMCCSLRIPVTALSVDVPSDEHEPVVTDLPIQQLIDNAYAELNLASLQPKVKIKRIRQHCNPMKASLMEPPSPPDWGTIFAEPELPLSVDIGSGQGRFVLLMAKRSSGSGNYLGLDVREKLVEKSNFWAKELNLNNMYFMTANATVSFGSLISTYPGKLTFVSILCPDPQFKRRLHKRRIVQPLLVDVILKYLAPGGNIFLESDVEDVAVDMRNHFQEHVGTSIVTSCEDCLSDKEGWLLNNPVGVCTEREISVLARGGRMYRLMYEKR